MAAGATAAMSDRDRPGSAPPTKPRPVGASLSTAAALPDGSGTYVNYHERRLSASHYDDGDGGGALDEDDSARTAAL